MNIQQHKSNDLKNDAVPLLPQINRLNISSTSESSYSESLTSRNLLDNNSTDESSSLTATPYSRSTSDGTYATSSTDVTNFSYNRLVDEYDLFEEQWRRANKHLQFDVNESSENSELWKKLAISLYEKIECWKEEKLLSYKTTIWDFCVLHTEDEIDQEIIEEYLKHLGLEGLIGTSLTNLDVGQERIEISTNILNNSSKIFVLNSPPFSQSGFHRLQYQESMMRKINFQDWKRKIIPLHPTNEYLKKYKEKYPLLSPTKGFSLFGLSSTVGIPLGNRTRTIEHVRRALTTDLQEINDKRRRRAKENFNFAIGCIFKSKCENLSKGLVDLKQQFQELNYTSEQLASVCIECENLQSLQLGDGPDQIIRLDNCSEISIGPSFHFNISSQYEIFENNPEQ